MTILLWLPEHPEPAAGVFALEASSEGWRETRATPSRAIAVVPASVVQWHVLRLPDLPRAKVAQAAASLIEPALMVDAERCVFCVMPTQADGLTRVAVIDREWLARAKDFLAGRGVVATRWVAETALLPRASGQWTLFERAGEWVLVRDDGYHALLDQAAEGEVPAVFRAALAARGAPKECVVVSIGRARAPLWLASCGVRARVGELSLRVPDDEDLLRPGRGAGWARWRFGAALAAGLVVVNLVGWLAHTAQMVGEEKTLRASLAWRAGNDAALAAVLARLGESGLAARVVALDFDGAKLEADIEAGAAERPSLSARLKAAGGTLVEGEADRLRVRFAMEGGR